MLRMGLDFETYGSVSLKKHGLARYVRDPYFTVLLAGVAHTDDGDLRSYSIDFVEDYFKSAKSALESSFENKMIVAHNAPFEWAVLTRLGIDVRAYRFVDSAMLARICGAGGHLEAAGPQLLGIDKMEEGKDLIKLFCIPGGLQVTNGNGAFDPWIVSSHPRSWDVFKEYCERDALLGWQISNQCEWWLTENELDYQAITMEMNQVGWRVDVDSVEEMQRRYTENQEQALYEFRQLTSSPDLNLNSIKQLKSWCGERGIRSRSFDEKHVTKLIEVIEGKLQVKSLDAAKRVKYTEVLQMLRTKQTLGGSSLKKLVVILDTVDGDRLRDQYTHAGAGQSLRTTGRSVQMQNLHKMGAPADMADLEDPDSEWDNHMLAENMRQVFTASEPGGALIVGDFAAVEGRGLAWLAGAEWKLNAYRNGEDMYKTMASKIYHTSYSAVDKVQRQTGKVGELACGYGAGGEAVAAFAEKMHIAMSELEASKLVFDWRQANPEIVTFWQRLDEMLHEVVETNRPQLYYLSDGLVLRIAPVPTPASLLKQHGTVKSVSMEIRVNGGPVLMRRFFLGCYHRGRNICYYKPSIRKTGDLWRPTYVDPKTNQLRYHELYGGKLAGILTQSMCREIFFGVLKEVHRWCRERCAQLQLVGQFHDEIVVDFKPGALSIEGATAELRKLMSEPGWFTSFPLAAEVKSDYRYTK